MDHDEDDDKRWGSRAQASVWIAEGKEVSRQDAEWRGSSPKIERASNKLENEYCEAIVLGMARGIARIPRAALYPDLHAPYPLQRAPIHYVDVSTLYRPMPGAEPGVQSAIMQEFLRFVRQPDVEWIWGWLKHTFPASARAADASAPTMGTERAPKSMGRLRRMRRRS
jgi:hypothetical protein